MEYSKHRFEFFSDGVMAIIITIIVLEIPLTNNFSFEGITSFLYSIFIFFVSFFIVGSFWNKHHGLIDHAKKITNKIIWKNMIFLFFLALLPIFTKWVLENPDNLIPVLSYDILFILANISFFLIVKEIYREKMLKRNEIDRDNREHPSIHIFSIIITLILIIILAILFPQITIILFIGFPIIFSLMNIFLDKNDPFEKILPNNE
ncbi:hypothetical protein MBCUT_01510 [Methanobrevibacter cuticularis]|uniref:DUF1211 domain-containing protein n=1 Tax=Methanobrevibacter cuticularis TaxID=47311 RepID=A0A166FHC3_9EURY|nr:TMEM175 family protein [Methanobrevibacter cuticularis]KZX17673.1 hypothetical protein MBCUT_01510 [Methanobrevibacter cuticularis]